MKNKNVKILIADDEEIIRRGIKKLLTNRGFTNIEEAEDGQQVLTIISESKNEFDFLLFDIKMPGINGLELLKTIKKLKPASKVIIVTGHGDVNTCRESFLHGAVDYITKPINVEQLYTSIESNIPDETDEGADTSASLPEEINIENEILKLINIIYDTKTDLLIREEAILQLGKYKDQRIVPILLEYLKHEIDKALKEKCIYVLGRTKDPSIYEDILNILKDKNEDSEIRMAAVMALRFIGKKEITEPFVKSLKQSRKNKPVVSKKPQVLKKPVNFDTIKVDMTANLIKIKLFKILPERDAKLFLNSLPGYKDEMLYIDSKNLKPEFIKSIAVMLANPKIDISVKKNTLNLLKSKNLFILDKNLLSERLGNDDEEISTAKSEVSTIIYKKAKPKYEFNEQFNNTVKRKIAREFYRIDLKKYDELYNNFHINTLNFIYDIINNNKKEPMDSLHNKFVREGSFHNPLKIDHLKKYFPKFKSKPLELFAENSIFFISYIRYNSIPPQINTENIVETTIILQYLLHCFRINYILIGDTFSPKIFDSSILKKYENESNDYIESISKCIENTDNVYQQNKHKIDNLSKASTGRRLLPYIYNLRQDFSEILFKYLGVEINDKSEAVTKGLLTDATKALIQSYKKFLIEKKPF